MKTASKLPGISEEMDVLEAEGRIRLFRYPEHRNGAHVTLSSKMLVNLSSNDYLGIADNKELTTNFFEYVRALPDDHGPLFASTASRLMTGAFEVQHKLENLLSALLGGKEVLLFNSGYHANLGILPALATTGDVIFADRLNHASLIDGMKLSGATFFRYHHGNLNHLEQLLSQHRRKFRRAFIVTESIFSMDGDCAELPALVNLKQQWDAFLIVDEAHAFGVKGPQGLGMAEAGGALEDIDLLVGTFGKALASQGAFAATSAEIKNYLIQKSRPLIYSTALPPISTHWVTYLLEHSALLSERRRALASLCVFVEKEMAQRGFPSEGEPFIQKIIFGSIEKTVQAFEDLKNNGILALPIRPPTVPEGSARLRLSLRADITPADLAPLWTFLDKATPLCK